MAGHNQNVIARFLHRYRAVPGGSGRLHRCHGPFGQTGGARKARCDRRVEQVGVAAHQGRRRNRHVTSITARAAFGDFNIVRFRQNVIFFIFSIAVANRTKKHGARTLQDRAQIAAKNRIRSNRFNKSAIVSKLNGFGLRVTTRGPQSEVYVLRRHSQRAR